MENTLRKIVLVDDTPTQNGLVYLQQLGYQIDNITPKLIKLDIQR